MGQNRTPHHSFTVGAHFFFFFFNNFINLFLAVLGLLCCVGFSLVVKSGDHCLVAVGGLLIAVASLVAELRLQARGLNSCGLRALHCRLSNVVQGLSCPAACGIFLDQGSNPCPLHWQADSYPLYHQVSPRCPLSMVAAGGKNLL